MRQVIVWMVAIALTVVIGAMAAQPLYLSNHAIPSLQTTAAAGQSVHAISDQSAFISQQIESIRC